MTHAKVNMNIKKKSAKPLLQSVAQMSLLPKVGIFLFLIDVLLGLS